MDTLVKTQEGVKKKMMKKAESKKKQLALTYGCSYNTALYNPVN